jgi:hypothetical protein
METSLLGENVEFSAGNGQPAIGHVDLVGASDVPLEFSPLPRRQPRVSR